MIETKANMTDGERIGALLRKEQPDRVPWFPIGGEVFSVIQEGLDIADTWQKPDQCLSAHRKVSQELGWVFWPRTAFTAMIASSYGGEIKYPTGKFAFVPTMVRRPVETVEEAMNLKLPDVRNSGFIPFQAEYYKKSSQDQLDCQYFGATLFGAAFTHAAVRKPSSNG